MKHSTLCSGSKPPSRSSCFSSSRLRSHVNPDRWQIIMQGFNGSKVSERSEKTSGLAMVSAASSKDVSDCISSWLAYLQMLSGLCNAGSRLSHSLNSLMQDTLPGNKIVLSQCQTMWEELVKATTVASSNIKSQILSLQEFTLLSESEADIQNTGQVIFSSLVTFINLQYQLSAACCECLGPVAGCNCLSAESSQKHEPDCSVAMIQQCFQRLFPFSNQISGQKCVKNPSNFSCSSFQISQRRWSEAAAQEAGGKGGSDYTMRRWSMPWEISKQADQSSNWAGTHSKPKLTVPSSNTLLDRSRSVTPESLWHPSMPSQEELQEVIKLLSCPIPSIQTSLHTPNSKAHLPGVTLTGCTLDVSSQETWSESTTPGSRRGSNSPHRGSWAIPESASHNWTEAISGTDSCYELNPAILPSRKSSSSTDSSSSHSLHSRSTTGSLSGASGSSESGELRTHLYSMWSGADLPFIKLPESNEPIKETITEPQTTSETRSTLFTPKSH